MKLFPYFSAIKNDIKWHGRAYVITDILFKAFALLIWLPIMGFIFSYLLKIYGVAAVSNTDIIHFVLSPIGIVTVLFFSIMFLSLFFAEHAMLMAIAFASKNDHKVHWVGALSLLKRKIKNLVLWGGGSIVILIFVLSPLFFGLLYAYLYYLSEFDINYYLQEKPREFIYFVIIACITMIPAIFLMAYSYISWLFALPIILFENESNVLRLLKMTHKRLYGYFWHIAGALISLWLSLLLFAFLYQVTLKGYLANFLFNFDKESPNWLITVMTFMLFLEITLNVVLQLIAIVGTVVIFVQIYLKQAKKEGISFVASSLSTSFSFNVHHKLLWPLVFLGFFISASYTVYDFNKTINIQNNTNVIAHRGASAKAPPNSRSAFLQAIADKADYIELDVQETKDGIVVVHHDKDYKLSSNIDKAVHELTWAETAAIDIGSSFSKDFAGEAVISLEETLKLAKDKINVLIELKYYGYNQNLEQRVLDLVHQTGMEEQVRYMSLNLEGIERLKSLAPTASVGYISSAAKIGDLSKINLDFVAVSTSLATKKFISHIQRKGKKAAVWTIDDTDEMLKLANFNIDAIITNRPDKLREVLQRHKKMTKAEILLSIYHNLWKE